MLTWMSCCMTLNTRQMCIKTKLSVSCHISLCLVYMSTSLSCLQTDSQEDTQASDESEIQSGPDYNYLLNMMLWYLTKEKKDELLKQRDAKAKELVKLRKMMPPDLWREDLEGFLEQLDVSWHVRFVKRIVFSRRVFKSWGILVTVLDHFSETPVLVFCW